MKVCVIGSGIFGIAAVREISRHLPEWSVHWVSEDPEAGGLWNTTSKRSRVYDTLFLNTSRQRSAFTGTAIPAEPSVHFVHHSLYSAYLAQVAAECQGPQRHWECRVDSVSAREGGGWLVRWHDRAGAVTEEEFDAVVDATGHNVDAVWPDVPRAAEPAYALSHSAEYKNAEPYRGKRVLVIGNGASAVDIACELITAASRVEISIRTPKWYLPKVLLGKPIDQSGGGLSHAPLVGRMIAAVGESVVRRVVGSYDSFGLEAPKSPLAISTPVLSDHFLPHISHGRLHTRTGVVALGQESVRFADGTEDTFDAVIAATGFQDASPHLPSDVRDTLSRHRLGLSLEAPGSPGLYLLNRFRCGDSAVKCAEVQAAAVARSLPSSRTRSGAPPDLAGPEVAGRRITARTLRKVYEAYR
ncbi:flavin-containing monooxygenase [Streptomyces sp. NPDC001513]|uniref:flavin-containing monooxygenase n=1 Tax=Streptomyces sp. NPDC001513 TaxID=3364580 RepID=UPI00368CB00F